MTLLLTAADHDLVSWPMLGLLFALSAAWDCFTGEVHFARYLEFDKYDSVGPYVFLVGAKFAIALLIFGATFFGTS